MRPLLTSRSQLRCGRESPKCTRCDRLDATCQYPNPPNRRGPRSQRNRAQLLQRGTEHDRERARSRHAVPQRLSNRPGPQHIPTQRLNNAAPQHRITSLGRNHLPQGDTCPDNDDETDNMSALLVAGTPVLSNVGIDTHFYLHRRVYGPMTDGSIVLFKTVACGKLIRNRSRPRLRSATVTTDHLWTFSAGDIFLTRV